MHELALISTNFESNLFQIITQNDDTASRVKVCNIDIRTYATGYMRYFCGKIRKIMVNFIKVSEFN